jgi:hypothetical protein
MRFDRSGRRRCWHWSWRDRRGLLWTDGVPGLHRGGFRRSSSQLLARRLASPCAGIDIAHHAQPFLGFRLAREESHMETEALASLFETAADEERKAFELGQIGLRERHRGRRGTQIEHERPCLSGRRC